ncbi:protein phosphatase-1, putative [Metarhizium acridum CQMa 102]|uniref:Protein phosphatase-1, putative n=1 Tax=Metarhizium acridum (strain CQMa 102) TaxID=655827 RepID=E9E8I7_METAQ|nr:protein phosphatase-1, putative [Metarhizium acridum CQMa 102]EFY87818.1 protein phosphatase-1, putative [Metarhizium acridum CQMa 102]
MADANATLEAKRLTVAASAKQCLLSLQQCLSKASSVYPQKLSMVEGLLSRLSLWTTDIRMFATDRTFLNYRLQHVPEVQTVVTDLLESLNYRIRTSFELLAYKDIIPNILLDWNTAHKTEMDISSSRAKLESGLHSDFGDIREFTCPYCFDTLPVEEIFDKEKWPRVITKPSTKIHVKNDLHPYVCLFEDRGRPDEICNTGNDCLRHLYEHRPIWLCSCLGEEHEFSAPEEYIQHLRDAHDMKFSDSEIRDVVASNTRKTAKLFHSCPLCGKDEAEARGSLKDHIAGHLISLALESLPVNQKEAPDDSETEMLLVSLYSRYFNATSVGIGNVYAGDM